MYGGQWKIAIDNTCTWSTVNSCFYYRLVNPLTKLDIIVEHSGPQFLYFPPWFFPGIHQLKLKDVLVFSLVIDKTTGGVHTYHLFHNNFQTPRLNKNWTERILNLKYIFDVLDWCIKNPVLEKQCSESSCLLIKFCMLKISSLMILIVTHIVVCKWV